MNNIKIINHAQALLLVQEADQIVQDYQERLGLFASSAGTLLSAITTAADNLVDFTSVSFTIDYTGYGIRYDSTLLTEDDVVNGIARGLEVMREVMDSED